MYIIGTYTEYKNHIYFNIKVYNSIILYEKYT